MERRAGKAVVGPGPTGSCSQDEQVPAGGGQEQQGWQCGGLCSLAQPDRQMAGSDQVALLLLCCTLGKYLVACAAARHCQS